MPQNIAEKLRIKEGMTLRTLHAPVGFAESLEAGVSASPKAKDYDQIHWFIKDRAQMEAEVEGVIGLLKTDVVCWIYYPKGSSGIQTDLTRDKGWESLLAHKELQWINLISFDDTWSAFGMRLQTAKDQKKKGPRAAGDYTGYIDPVARTIRVPEDLEKALKPHKQARAFFDSLAFSHRREYVEWILGAKREETRLRRVRETLERLEQGWKNPRNL